MSRLVAILSTLTSFLLTYIASDLLVIGVRKRHNVVNFNSHVKVPLGYCTVWLFLCLVIFSIRYDCVNYYCVRGNIRHQEKVERWILTKLQKDGSIMVITVYSTVSNESTSRKNGFKLDAQIDTNGSSKRL